MPFPHSSEQGPKEAVSGKIRLYPDSSFVATSDLVSKAPSSSRLKLDHPSPCTRLTDMRTPSVSQHWPPTPHGMKDMSSEL